MSEVPLYVSLETLGLAESLALKNTGTHSIPQVATRLIHPTVGHE